MAGKTGTAQVISRRGTAAVDPRSLPMHLRHRSLFVGFAPADNPTIAIAIAVEGGGYGGSTAGPMARKIFDAYLLGKMPEKEGEAAAPAGTAPATSPATAPMQPTNPNPNPNPSQVPGPSRSGGAPAQGPSPMGRGVGVRVGEEGMGGDAHGVAALIPLRSNMPSIAPAPTLTPTPLSHGDFLRSPGGEELEAASTVRRQA
jgi:penicillin-binding protein 2